MFKYVLPLTAIGGLLLAAPVANAAGFQLKEQGAELQGLSYAGATARASDLSTLFYNPAGMSNLAGTQVQFESSLIVPSAEFNSASSTVTGNEGGDAGEAAVLPAFYFMKQVNDRTHFGVAVNTPFGLSTDYKEGWQGRYHALESELKTVNINPNLSYKVNDKLSVAGGLQLQYIDARLTNAINVATLSGTPGAPDGRSKLNGDDIGYGFNLAAMYNFDEDSRIGVAYRSRIKHKLTGDIVISDVPGALGIASAAAEADVTLPDVLSVGGYHKLNDQWAVLGEFSWTNWSTFDELVVNNQSDGAERQNVQYNWEDSYFFALGTEYDYDDKTQFQFGVAYDMTPTQTSNRTFRIPDSDRYWLSAGMSYDLTPKVKVRGGYTHIIAKEPKVFESNGTAQQGDVSGDYDASVNILSVGLTYKF